jgi:hypothetical protein
LFSIYIQNIRLKGVTVALWVRLDLFWNEGVARKVIRSGGLTPRKIPCESSSGGALVEPGNRCDVSCFPRPKSWARRPSRASRLECGNVETWWLSPGRFEWRRSRKWMPCVLQREWCRVTEWALLDVLPSIIDAHRTCYVPSNCIERLVVKPKRHAGGCTGWRVRQWSGRYPACPGRLQKAVSRDRAVL